MDSLIAFIIGLVIGLTFALFDSKKGKFWYRSWYKLTHKDPLPEDSTLTFIKDQPFSARLVPAIILSFITGYIFFVTGELNILIVGIYALLMMIGMLVSFYAFPFFMNKVKPQLGNVRETIQKIDEIEASIKSEPKTKTPEREELPPTDNSKDKKDDNWRSGVKDFLDK